jgi:hypothetical protein
MAFASTYSHEAFAEAFAKADASLQTFLWSFQSAF